MADNVAPPATAKVDEAFSTHYRRIVFAGALGTGLENYDMFLYALIAPIVFDKLFFPKMDAHVGAMVVFATFAVGFLARPLGSIVFGHFGDRIGRKTVLVYTLLMMGIATMLMGVLPSYASIGIWAPTMLIFLRICQGFAIGGQTGGAAVLSIESAPTAKRGFWAACVQIGAPMGTVLASLVVSILTGYCGRELFGAWVWRIPFLSSVLLIILGIYTRYSVDESVIFAKAKPKEKPRAPLALVLKNYKKSMLCAMLAVMSQSAFLYLTCIFSIALATKRMGMSQSKLTAFLTIANCIAMLTVPLYGHLSDRIGRRPFLMLGIALCAVYIYPFFLILQMKDNLLLGLAIMLAAGFIHPLIFSQEPSFTSELFPTEVRYTGASVSKHFGSALGGGLAPLIATSLMGKDMNFKPVFIYFVIIAIAGFTAAFLAPESSKLSLTRKA